MLRFRLVWRKLVPKMLFLLLIMKICDNIFIVVKNLVKIVLLSFIKIFIFLLVDIMLLKILLPVKRFTVRYRLSLSMIFLSIILSKLSVEGHLETLSKEFLHSKHIENLSRKVFLTSPNVALRMTMAGMCGLSILEQEKLAKDIDVNVRLKLVENCLLSTFVQETLSEDPNKYVRLALINRTDLPFTAQLQLAVDKDIQVRIKLAMKDDDNDSVTDLHYIAQIKLANDTDSRVLVALANMRGLSSRTKHILNGNQDVVSGSIIKFGH